MCADGIEKRGTYNRQMVMKDILKNHSSNELDYIDSYFQDIEGKFRNDKKRIHDRYNEERAKIKSDLELESQLAEYFSEEFDTIDSIFLKTFRYSMVVAIYSLVEVNLNDLFRYLCNSKKMTLTIDDLRDDGIQRAKSYLTKVCMIDFPINSHGWNHIIQLNQIRNCIVHAQGNVGNMRSPEKLKKVVGHTPGISIKDERYLIVESNYIENSIQNAKTLLDNIFDKSFERT